MLSNGREIRFRGRAGGGRFPWSQRNIARAFLNTQTELASLRTLLVRAGKAMAKIAAGIVIDPDYGQTINMGVLSVENLNGLVDVLAAITRATLTPTPTQEAPQ